MIETTQARGKASELTQERLKHLLHYDPNTGIFTRKTSVRHASKGSVSGSDNGEGYLRICVDGVRYYSHKLAWLYMTGEYPDHFVDHSDCDHSNNRWSNLRVASAAENCRNRRRSSVNRSGFKGVHWRVERSKWVASIAVDGKNRRIGSFDCPAAAHFAYVIAANKHYGEFARAA